MLIEENYHQRAQLPTKDYKRAMEQVVQDKFVICYKGNNCFG